MKLETKTIYTFKIKIFRLHLFRSQYLAQTPLHVVIAMSRSETFQSQWENNYLYSFIPWGDPL